MVVWSATERPTKLAIGFSDRVFVNAGMTFPHQAILGKFPVLVAIGAKPLAAVIAIFVGVSNGDTIAGEGPEFLDEAIVEFLVPLAGQEGLGLGAVPRELGAVAPARIERVGKRYLGSIATIPAIFGKAYLFDGTLSGEWGKRGTGHEKFL